MHDAAVPDPAGIRPAGPRPEEPRRRTVELGGDEALRLLSEVPIGRIVFTRHALPAIRPVNHLVDGGAIVIRTHEGAALTRRTRHAGPGGVVVAYEADSFDSRTRLGRSVVVIGYCHLVTDPEETARYRAVLHPWTDRQGDHVVRIRPDVVTGVRLVPAGPDSFDPCGSGQRHLPQ
ncbi:pyridoxamine 5'-phosphate oxidase family protein [Streptomyces sp. NPDC101115]|uniref:pyridoxamine 5'-phosphate oxidase family protein n=1 Tax=Streptomyces sp. NPDC101115 TaxID=3366106 RepID=UPI003817F811